MLENMTTEEKVIAGITAVGIAALVFHKPTRNAVGLSDGRENIKATGKIEKSISSGSSKIDTQYIFETKLSNGKIFKRSYEKYPNGYFKPVKSETVEKRYKKTLETYLKNQNK